MKQRIEYWAALAVIGSLRFTPLAVANTLARLYARLLDVAIPRLRRTAYRNLTIALPDADAPRITNGVFDSIARLLVAFARFPDINTDTVGAWIRYDGLENFEAARAKRKGVLVATAHLGNWELSAYTHALMTAPMHVVARALDNRFIDHLVERRRELSGNTVILKREAARPILRALATGSAVGILIDQNASVAEGVFVPFFGIPACANSAFVKFAHHSGAPVVPGFALWSDAERRYVLHFYPEIPMTGDVATDTAALQAFLEARIREHPDQWLWIHRRWKTRPRGEPPLY